MVSPIIPPEIRISDWEMWMATATWTPSSQTAIAIQPTTSGSTRGARRAARPARSATTARAWKVSIVIARAWPVKKLLFRRPEGYPCFVPWCDGLSRGGVWTAGFGEDAL